MAVVFNNLPANHLGYSAVFLFIATGFLFLKLSDRNDVGPGYWALAFLCNSLGFLCWSTILPLADLANYALGEVFHIAGFFFLACGAYRFMGHAYRGWNLAFASAWLVLWASGLLLLGYDAIAALFVLRGARAILFLLTAAILLRPKGARYAYGRKLAGYSLCVWALWVMVYAFIPDERLLGLVFGILVGIQILSALGMIIMIVERKSERMERTEMHAERLEGLLPICAHCKKIRDKDGNWQVLEYYIESRSRAEFSHGVCPECLKKHYGKYLD
jgi:hypothetical protein